MEGLQYYEISHFHCNSGAGKPSSAHFSLLGPRAMVSSKAAMWFAPICIQFTTRLM
jgi:hypothetical protein